MTPLNRQIILEKAARLLEDRFDVNSANLTREMGKPLAESKIEMQVAIDLLRWYGEEGKRIYGRIIPSRFPGMQHEARKVPVGPALGLCCLEFSGNKCNAQSCRCLGCGLFDHD